MSDHACIVSDRACVRIVKFSFLLFMKMHDCLKISFCYFLLKMLSLDDKIQGINVFMDSVHD